MLFFIEPGLTQFENPDLIMIINNILFFIETKVMGYNVSSVDDIVDSRMSFLACGKKLKENNSGNVYPFVLASSSKGGNLDE